MTWAPTPHQGRGILMSLVCAGGLAAGAALMWEGRGGAIHADSIKEAATVLGTLYIPLFTIICVFFFSGKPEQDPNPHTLAFLLAAFVTFVWVSAAPALLLATNYPIEEILDLLRLDVARMFGESIVAGALSFYFNVAR